MMRALWTAASGMKTQQMYVDSIANNIANVNTAGYKKENMEFKSLFYETLRESGLDENGFGRPVSLQIGNGVRASVSSKQFTQGSIEMTGNPLDFSLEGSGFFMIRGIDGDPIYTKQGSFKLSLFDDALTLVTSDGYPILDAEGEIITFDGNYITDNIAVDQEGNFTYVTADGTEDLGIQLGVAQFRNPAGLDALGGTFYKQTNASGEPIIEADNDEIEKSVITQRSVEASNVQVVEEMIKMIVAQRAYEMNSKAIQTSDDMMGLANNLKR